MQSKFVSFSLSVLKFVFLGDGGGGDGGVGDGGGGDGGGVLVGGGDGGGRAVKGSIKICLHCFFSFLTAVGTCPVMMNVVDAEAAESTLEAVLALEAVVYAL